MKWFKHDSDANTDAKLKKVRHKYGITGYGLYWYCVELIAGSVSAKNITFELEEDAEIIALEWRLDQLYVQEIMQYMVSVGLFDIADNNRIRCLKLAKRLDDTNAKNPQIKAIIDQLNYPNDSELIGETPRKSEKVRPDKIRLDKNRKEQNKKNIHAGLAEKLNIDVGLVERVVKHRRDIKHPANTDKKITLVIRDLEKCVEQGFFDSLAHAMDRLDQTEWRTLKPEYLEEKGNAKNKRTNSKHGARSFEQIDYGAGVNTDGTF